MSYTKEDLEYFQVKDLQDARKKIVDVRLFDYIEDLNISKENEKLMNFTKELYEDYLKEILGYSKETQEEILKALMNSEIIDNHTLERENVNFLRIYNETHHSTAIRYLARRLLKDGTPLNDAIIKKAHEILMRGTSNESIINEGFRTNNHHYVGYIEENKPVINYFPISYDDIKESITLLCKYFNTPITKEEELFIKPFIMHGLIAVLQTFEDGNTRLARCFQHITLQDITNKTIGTTDNFELPLPAIYFSKNYVPYRNEYRELLANIALNPNNEAWNEWISFNLHKMQDRIFANEESLVLLKRKKK